MADNSKSGESPTLKRAFELLDRWRHLPAYQLERRADIFFALYLPEVLEKHFGTKINHCLIPEFPIKKVLLPRYNENNNRSINVDYLALQEPTDGETAEQAFLVELKTDNASIDKDQLCDLLHAANCGLECLVKGVIDICRSSTNQKRKYAHLLRLLSCLDLVRDGDVFPLPPRWCGKKRWGYADLKEGIRSNVTDRISLKLVYVAPKMDCKLEEAKIPTIDFNCFADVIEKGDPDGIRRTFACHLRNWAKERAGTPYPKDLRSC